MFLKKDGIIIKTVTSKRPQVEPAPQPLVKIDKILVLCK